MYKVRWEGKYPKKKHIFHPGEFRTRRKARNWCRINKFNYEGLTIIHPNGLEEKYNILD